MIITIAAITLVIIDFLLVALILIIKTIREIIMIKKMGSSTCSSEKEWLRSCHGHINSEFLRRFFNVDLGLTIVSLVCFCYSQLLCLLLALLGLIGLVLLIPQEIFRLRWIWNKNFFRIKGWDRDKTKPKRRPFAIPTGMAIIFVKKERPRVRSPRPSRPSESGLREKLPSFLLDLLDDP